MAEVTLAGGLVVDIATSEDLDRHHAALEAMLNGKGPRVIRPQRVAGNAPNGGGTKPIIADLGAPPAGLIWRVEFLVVFADAPFGAAIANVTAAVFIGSVPGGAALTLGPPVTGVSIGDVILPALAVPSVNQAPDRAYVFSNEHLYAVFAGTGLVAGGANYRAVAGVTEMTDGHEALTV